MNVLELVGIAGISPKKVASTKGGEYHSACPACGGNDRFHVWPEQHGGNGSYWCRRCSKSGDNIQFLIDFEGLKGYSARQITEMQKNRWPALRCQRIAFPGATGEVYPEHLARAMEMAATRQKLAEAVPAPRDY